MFLLALGALSFVFYDGLSYMVEIWGTSEEYSHGYMIPMVALYLIWKKQWEVKESMTTGAWISVPILMFGLVLFLVGELSSLYTIIQYAFLVCFFAIILAFIGLKSFKILLPAITYLVFMIPLPVFLYNSLSAELQLISSAIGVAVVRAFDISVYLEGNVIDLGVYQLQVVEACSGLRYLFPLMSFGYLIAFLYKGPMWIRAILFLSTIPITVLMNSFRIGVIGVTVEYWGIEMAEGFLHDFEGWVIFVGCLGVLVLEVWFFQWLRKGDGSLIDNLDLDLPEETLSMSDLNFTRQTQKPLIACLGLMLMASLALPMLESRQEEQLERTSFSQFPLYNKSWNGREDSLEESVLDALKLTDYFIANYTSKKKDARLNFYVAYYSSQRKGSSIHSPRSCIPGGGWKITGLREHTIDSVISREGKPLNVNRILIQKDGFAQIVYYWFEQRHRNVTNEYLAKWFIFWDSLTMNRTDGALVRVTVPVPDIADIDVYEEQATQFVIDFYPELIKHLPEA
ncbi:hypothetical protein BST96_08185 [Oceanicoccus sagamiensis]|uniref:Methanolan biosynthesis EpsI domain-containing protein n=2 Tax=Oceanicoccus sagamiensis TaxID=716816 RepID=A0A1X9NE74_9GAMM|nr:hypothetical protein BST96_08185 [Oceanicoccus sagamiensis]